MKKLILIFILFVPYLLNAQGSSIFSINNTAVDTKPVFIDDFYDSQSAYSLNYVGANPIDIMVGGKTYIVRTAKFTDLENEPGFNVITVSLQNQLKFVHKQIDGLIKFNDRGNLYGPSLAQYSDNNIFIKEQLSDNVVALIFVGWPFNSTPSQLLIMVLTPDDIKIVYNKNMNINYISNNGNNFSMIAQSNVLEEGVGVPITHTIWKKDGVLWFKNN